MSAAQERLQALNAQMTAPIGLPPTGMGKQAVLSKNPDDIVITFALRTPLTRAGKGAFKDTKLDDMLIPLLSAVRERSQVPTHLFEEIVLGNVLHPSPAFTIRCSALAAGYPVTTATSIVSRWCSSGLLAVQSIANQILAGAIDVGVAVGAESMSTNADKGAPPGFSDRITAHAEARDTFMPMGWTSENVAGDFHVTRQKQDRFAAESFQLAERSQRAGWPADEILPMTVTVRDHPGTTGKAATTSTSTVLADRDDGVRYGTTPESLSKVRAAFPQWAPATTTGGNASQITDGAAAIVLMKRRKADELGLKVLARFVASTVVGLEPRIMGIGPSYAIPKILSKTGLTKDDVDIFEINEAFASMGVYCVEKLGLPREKVNPRGGAIAFGHPLGATGARQIVTALSEMKRTGKKICVTSMCVGTGMGMASVIISEQ